MSIDEIPVVPIGSYDNYLTYPEGTPHHMIRWVANEPFEDEIAFMEFSRGRSAAHAQFVSDKRRAYYVVFLTDLGEMIGRGIAVGGVVKGTFIGCKRGANYGIRFYHGERG